MCDGTCCSKSIVAWTGDNWTHGVNNYHQFWASDASNPGDLTHQTVMPENGYFSNLCIQIKTPLTAGEKIEVTMMINDISSDLTIVIQGDTTTIAINTSVIAPFFVGTKACFMFKPSASAFPDEIRISATVNI